MLVGLGFIQRNNSFYYLPPALTPWLRVVPGNVLKEIVLYQRENAVWLRSAAIISGEQAPIEYRRELLDSQLGEYPGIQLMNEILAIEILDTFATLIAQAKLVADIGGGDGLYAGLILARNAETSVRIVDLDSGFGMCDRYREHLDDGRLQLTVSDARTVTLEADHDLVMINELLELFPANEKRMILARAVQALAPRGRIFVTKFDLDSDGLTPASSALFSLRMRMKTNQSYLESNDEVVQTLTDLGLHRYWKCTRSPD